MKKIEYFFSPSSPWTYLGHQRLVAMAARHDADIEVLPVDIGGKIFPGSGGLPLPKRAPQRQAYRLVDLQRWAAFLDVPLNLQPRHFPTPGHEAARLIILAGQRHGSGAALQVSYAAMHGLWAQELDISDLPTLARLADGCSLPGDKLVAELAAADEAYAANTQRAIDAQVFGAPWYRYRDEPFWGQDRLDFLERALAGST